MSKLDPQYFILSEHKDLPKEQQVLWTYHVPTFGDDMVSRRVSSKLPEDEQGEAFILARIASTVDQSKGVLRGRVADEYPTGANLEARMAWISRLPPGWVMELAKAVSEESDLTLEDE